MPLLLGAIGVASSCGGQGAPQTVIEFAGQQEAFPASTLDTDWFPPASPVAVRAVTTAKAELGIVAQASVNGEALEPEPGSGELAIEAQFSFDLSARIDTAGISYEGSVGSFEYGVERTAVTFDPFALEEDVVLEAMLPAAEIARVPVASVPGTTVVLGVTGGVSRVTLRGTCAGTDGVVAWYEVQTNTSIELDLEASVEIEVPIVGKEVFGPFPVAIEVPEQPAAAHLGTFDVATGMPAPEPHRCDADAGTTSTTTDEGGSMSATSDATSGDDTHGEGTEASSDGPTEGESTGVPEGDPVYPPPWSCPPGAIAVSSGSPGVVGFCSSPCQNKQCPPAQSGDATPVCGFNPEASFGQCENAADCTGDEACVQSRCVLPPTHCALSCALGEACPNSMACSDFGFCEYLD